MVRTVGRGKRNGGCRKAEEEARVRRGQEEEEEQPRSCSIVGNGWVGLGPGRSRSHVDIRPVRLQYSTEYRCREIKGRRSGGASILPLFESCLIGQTGSITNTAAEPGIGVKDKRGFHERGPGIDGLQEEPTTTS